MTSRMRRQRKSDLSSRGSGPRQRPVEDAACGGHDERQRKQYGALWVGRGAWTSDNDKIWHETMASSKAQQRW